MVVRADVECFEAAPKDFNLLAEKCSRLWQTQCAADIARAISNPKVPIDVMSAHSCKV